MIVELHEPVDRCVEDEPQVFLGAAERLVGLLDAIERGIGRRKGGLLPVERILGLDGGLPARELVRQHPRGDRDAEQQEQRGRVHAGDAAGVVKDGHDRRVPRMPSGPPRW